MPSKIKTCENYRAAFIEAAATTAASELPHELRLHFDACAPCRTAFNEERQLFAAIDSGLRVTANSESPASLLARVRAQVNEQSVPRRSWIPAWTASFAVVVLACAVVWMRGTKREPAPSPSGAGSFAKAVVPAHIPQVSAAGGVEKPPALVRNHSLTPRATGPKAAVEQVAVLLPPGQKEAVDALLAGLRRGTVTANDLPAEKTTQPLLDLQVLPLGVSPLEVKPLEDVSGSSTSASEPAKS